MEGSGKPPLRVHLLSRYFVSEKQKSKGCRGLIVEIPTNLITVGQFFKDICERFSLKCISRRGAILKVKGTPISHDELVTVLRDDDLIKVEGDFLRTEGGKLPGEEHYTRGISSCSYFSDSERRMNHSASNAASVCGPRRKLDDGVNSFNGPKVDYPIRKSTCDNYNSMFNINDFFDSYGDFGEPVVTVASVSSGLKILLDDAEKRKLAKTDSKIDVEN